MTASQALYAILTSDPDLNLITEKHVAPVRGEDTWENWITFTRIGGNQEVDHSGPADYEDSRFQIDAFSRELKTVDIMREKILGLLNGKRFEIGGTEVVFIHLDDTDTFEPSTKTFGAAIDFSVQI